MIQQDLGDLVTEIPVSDLKDIVIGKEDLEQIGKQPWTRGQVSGSAFIRSLHDFTLYVC